MQMKLFENMYGIVQMVTFYVGKFQALKGNDLKSQ